MNSFTFSYEGMYLGGIIVVVAPEVNAAKRMARSYLKKLVKRKPDVKTENFRLIKSEPIPPKGGVLYNDDGDY